MTSFDRFYGSTCKDQLHRHMATSSAWSHGIVPHTCDHFYESCQSSEAGAKGGPNSLCLRFQKWNFSAANMDTKLKSPNRYISSQSWPKLATALIACILLSCSILAEARISGTKAVYKDGAMVKQILSDSINQTVTCRVVLIDTLYETHDGRIIGRDETACVPLSGGVKSENTFRLKLPQSVWKEQKVAIANGGFHAAVSDARIRQNEIVMSNSSVVTGKLKPMLSRLQYYGNVTTRTVAVVRVSLSDANVSFSADAIRNQLFGPGINFVTQYRACSAGQMDFQLAPVGVLDVFINQSISVMNTTYAIMAATENKILIEQKMSVSKLADYVMFCLPPGAGSWIASAGVN